MFNCQFQISLFLSLLIHSNHHAINTIRNQGNRNGEAPQRVGRGYISILNFRNNQAHLSVSKRLLAELAQDTACHDLRNLKRILRLGNEPLEHTRNVIATPSLGEHEHVEMTATLPDIHTVALLKIVSGVVDAPAQVTLQQEVGPDVTLGDDGGTIVNNGDRTVSATGSCSQLTQVHTHLDILTVAIFGTCRLDTCCSQRFLPGKKQTLAQATSVFIKQ